MKDWVIAVIGSRTYTNYEELTAILDSLIAAQPERNVSLISGGARGADSLAERYAAAAGITIVVLKPDYVAHGKAAPFIRNKDIIDGCSEVVYFWDGQSRGTKHAVDYAESLGRPLSPVLFDPPPKKSFFDTD